jgi:hypothetical protein
MQVTGDWAAAINKLIKLISDYSYSFLVAVAAVGVLAMAILQTLKDMLPLRQWFQRYWVNDWLKKRVGTDAKIGKEAEIDLIRLATDGNDKAFYDLPIEQLCGQMNAAAQAVLDNPKDHEALLRSLAKNANAADIKQVMDPPVEIRRSRADLNDAEKMIFDSYVDARNRVTHQVQRAIDALQVSAGFRWKHLLQISSILLSAFIAGMAVFLYGGIPEFSAKLVATLVVAVLGGFLAPVARDLVASLQQLRK